MSLTQRITLQIAGEITELERSLAEATTASRGFLDRANADLARAQAAIKKQAASGELSAEKAVEAEVAAIRKRNDAVIAEIERARKAPTFATPEANNAYIAQLAAQVKDVKPVAEQTAAVYVRTLTQGIERDFAAAAAQIKQDVARGLLTPKEAAAQGEAAAKAYNTALLGHIDQVRANPQSVTSTGGADAVAAALAGKLKNVAAEGAEAASALDTFTNAAQTLGGPLGSAVSQVSSLTSVLTSATGVAAAAAVAIVAIGVKATLMAAEVDEPVRRVAAALDLTGEQSAQLREELGALAVEAGRTETAVVGLMEGITQGGPGSVAGLRAMTQAALELSDLTGKDANTLAAGLDGVIDAFGLSAEGARQYAADLYAVTKGKAPLEDLFAVLGRVAAQARGAGITLDDLEGAVAALLDAGVAPRQLASEIEKLATSGENGRRALKELAGGARDGAKNLAEFDAKLKDIRGSSEFAARQLRSEFDRELTSLGTVLLEVVNPRLQAMLDKIDRIRAANFGQLVAAALPIPGIDNLVLPNVPKAGPPVTTESTDKDPVAKDPAELQAQRRLEAIKRATKEIGDVTKAQVQAYIAELDRMAFGATASTSAIARGDAATLKDELTAKLDQAGKTLDSKAHALADKTRAASEAVASALRQIGADFAHETQTQVDDLRQQITALDDQAAKLRAQQKGVGKDLDPAAAAAFAKRRADLEHQIELTKKAEAAARSLADATNSAGRDAANALHETLDAIDQITEKRPDGVLDLVDDTDVETLTALEEELQRIVKLAGDDGVAAGLIDSKELEAAKKKLEEIRAILNQIAPTSRDPKKKPDADVEPKKAHDWATEIARGARALVEGASAAGLLDDRMTKIANSAVTLAESLSKAIQSKGADVGADLAALASAANLVKGVFGKSEKDKERERTDAANVRALEQIAKHLGDLVGLAVSGKAFGLARNVVGSIVSQTADKKDTQKITNVGDILDATGLSAADLEAIAKQLHIVIDGTVGSYRRLYQAIKDADFRAFAESWEGILAEMAVFNQVDRVDTPLAKLQAFVEALGRLNTGNLSSPVIGSILGGNFDLTTDDGRAALRAAAVSWLQAFRSGLVDPSVLGDLTPEQFLQALQTLIGDIDDAAAQAAQDIKDKVVAAFQAIADALSTLDLTAKIDGTGINPTILQQQVQAWAKGLPEAFRGAFAHLSDGIDFTDAAGRATLKKRLQDYYREVLLADGVLDDAERQIAQGILSIIGEIDDLATSAADAAEKLRAATNQKTLDTAEQTSVFRHDTEPQAFARKVSAYGDLSPEFKKLAEGLDLTTKQGLDAFIARLDALGLRIEANDHTLDLGTLTLDEFTQAALGLEQGAASATQAIAALAVTLGTKLSQAATDATRLGKDPVRAQADVIAKDPKLSDIIGGADLSTPGGRHSALVALQGAYATGHDEAVGQAIDFLLGQPDAKPALPALSASPNGDRDSAAFSSLTSEQGSALIALEQGESAVAREQLAVQRSILDELRASALSTLPVPAYRPPNAGPASFTIAINSPLTGPISIGAGASPADVTRLVEQIRGEMLRMLQRLNTDLGGALDLTFLFAGDPTIYGAG